MLLRSSTDGGWGGAMHLRAHGSLWEAAAANHFSMPGAAVFEQNPPQKPTKVKAFINFQKLNYFF